MSLWSGFVRESHQRYFIPTCTCLEVVTVDVMRPQVGDTSPAALVNATRPDGTAKFARLNMLNASSRSCTDWRARATTAQFAVYST